jgi:hypothetical protein
VLVLADLSAQQTNLALQHFEAEFDTPGPIRTRREFSSLAAELLPLSIRSVVLSCL